MNRTTVTLLIFLLNLDLYLPIIPHRRWTCLIFTLWLKTIFIYIKDETDKLLNNSELIILYTTVYYYTILYNYYKHIVHLSINPESP